MVGMGLAYYRGGAPGRRDPSCCCASEKPPCPTGRCPTASARRSTSSTSSCSCRCSRSRSTPPRRDGWRSRMFGAGFVSASRPPTSTPSSRSATRSAGPRIGRRPSGSASSRRSSSRWPAPVRRLVVSIWSLTADPELAGRDVLAVHRALAGRRAQRLRRQPVPLLPAQVGAAGLQRHLHPVGRDRPRRHRALPRGWLRRTRRVVRHRHPRRGRRVHGRRAGWFATELREVVPSRPRSTLVCRPCRSTCAERPACSR